MKNVFFSSAYDVKHSTITPENAELKLATDIRARMLGDVDSFLYAKPRSLMINSDLMYVGGFYYEKEDVAFSTCESTVNAELAEIDMADIIMVSLLKYSAIATITELLYASRFPEKEIIVFCDPTITKFRVEYEYWFPILASTRTTQNLRVVYVKNNDDILEFIKNFRVQGPRVIIEGTDGIGKTTVCGRLRALGVECLDREMEISKVMENCRGVGFRAGICEAHLRRHPEDCLVFLTTKDANELEQRLKARGRALDSFDACASMYNDIYSGTAKWIESERFVEVDVTGCDEQAEFLKVCDALDYNGFMRKIVVATNNVGKINELRKILPDFLMLSLKDLNIEVEIEENADSFVGNAFKKAKTIHDMTGLPVIADDSGLVIDVLDGFPGVMTHRFMGDDATDEQRNMELIRLVNEKNDNRTAWFICKLVYIDNDRALVGDGGIVGKIADRPRGKNGFGFDPIFELEDGRTLAELLPVEKNELSARRLAAIDLYNKLRG